jgi:release factor glutamine methyltransferase
VLGTTPSALPRDRGRPVDVAAFQALIARRAAHEPLALILGRREFWSLDFAVSPATLIPRPDTETLIEAALAIFAGRDPPRRLLDLGTGTGCLLLAALSEFPAAFGVGVDRSFAAVTLAARNAAMLGTAGRATFLCADWASALDARFDLVLANPPYIPTAQIDDLMPEVARHEPRVALDGGTDGYCAYRRLVPDLARLLAPGGVAVLELGAGQAAMVARLARIAGFASQPHHDLSGIARALVLRRASP